MNSPQELMILCSLDSQPLLPKEGLERMNIIWTSQGREKILEILRDVQPPLLILYCCPPSEAVAFEELFKSYPKRKMLDSLAVLGEKEQRCASSPAWVTSGLGQ